MKPLRPDDVTHLVVHCSDATWGNPKQIKGWHLDRGFEDIGYHFIICNARFHSSRDNDPMTDGLILPGRPTSVRGEHAKGMNHKAIGICLIGKHVFSEAQLASLERQCRDLLAEFRIPVAHVLGHHETPNEQAKPVKHRDPAKRRKTCPNIDMEAFRQRLWAASP